MLILIQISVLLTNMSTLYHKVMTLNHPITDILTVDDASKSTNRKLKFEGYFKNGKREGKGRINNQDGSFYVGNYENNMPNGKGYYKWAEGEEYEGQWRDGKLYF